MKTIFFFVATLIAFTVTGQSIAPEDSSAFRPIRSDCIIITGPRWPLLPALSADVTIHTINTANLSNGSFHVIMGYNQTVALIRANFSSLSSEMKEKGLKYLNRINENINKGYGYYHPDGIHTFNRAQLITLPQRNINSVAGLVSGVDSRNGQTPNIRGARADGTAYFIDGVRMNDMNGPETVIGKQ